MLSLTLATTTSAEKDASLQSVYDDMEIETNPSDFTIHDPSRIITVGSKQMIAVTGKAQEDGYRCGIETWWREKGEKGNWHPGQCLFQTKPDWVKEEAPRNDGAFWAPELDLKDSKLTLLYSVSEMEDDPTTCVGIARSTTGLDGFPDKLSWEDTGEPITCIIGADYDEERSAIDPSLFWGMGDDSDRLFLVTGGGFIIGSELDPISYGQLNGEWFDVNNRKDWYELARGPEVDEDEHDWVEAAYIHPNPKTKFYYLFVNWGACCSGIDSTYEIRVGRSKNPMGPYFDKKGNNMMNDGGTLLEKTKGYVIGPGHTGIWTNNKGKDHISFHYYDKRREGNSWIAEKSLKWKKGWPKLSKKVRNSFPQDMLD